jgi:predicted nucleic acid-binding protein
MPNAFVDTNILVYAAEEKTPRERKTSIARELMLQPGLHLSVQVINEFIANARHPRKLALPREREKRWLQGWLQRPVASITRETVIQALAIHARYGISHWDSLIVSSALETGCKIIYSEDMNHGQDYAGAKVVNPFL